jgi:hypothetical protein
MSERRSIPLMQYTPPEDGHANHGAVDVKEALTIFAGVSHTFGLAFADLRAGRQFSESNRRAALILAMLRSVFIIE